MPDSISLEWAEKSRFLAFMCLPYTELELPTLWKNTIRRWHSPEWVERQGPEKRAGGMTWEDPLTVGELLILPRTEILQFRCVGPKRAIELQRAITNLYHNLVSQEVPIELQDVMQVQGPDGQVFRPIKFGLEIDLPLRLAWVKAVRWESALLAEVSDSEGQAQRSIGGKVNFSVLDGEGVVVELDGFMCRLDIPPDEFEGMTLEQLEDLQRNVRGVKAALNVALDDKIHTINSAIYRRRQQR